MSSVQDKFTEKLIYFRKQKNLSQSKLAILSGVDRAFLSKIESKQAVPTILTLEKLANALEIEVKEFFEG